MDIARAALGLFQEKGYESTTVGDIAEAADYSVRSFYRHFSSKEDVVFLDIGDLLDEVREAITDVPTGTSLWQVVRDSVTSAITRFDQAGPDFAADVARLWMTDPALAGPFFRFCERWQRLIAQGWSDAYGSGDPEADLPAQQVAHYAVSTCQACIRVHLRTGEDLAALLVQAFDRLECGLDGFPQSPRRAPRRHASAAARARARS
jgi:AcrR family transcriptional regulator